MKRELISIVTATLLACSTGAAAEKPSSAPCSAGRPGIAVVHGAAPPSKAVRFAGVRRPAGDCGAVTLAQFARGNQKFLSDKELEQALKRQLRGRLIDAKLNAARVEYTVLWEERQAGKRKLRKLIVDAKTGKVKREIRGRS